MFTTLDLSYVYLQLQLEEDNKNESPSVLRNAYTDKSTVEQLLSPIVCMYRILFLNTSFYVALRTIITEGIA